MHFDKVRRLSNGANDKVIRKKDEKSLELLNKAIEGV